MDAAQKGGSEPSFTHKEASSFDFSNAQVYRKTATLDKSKVEVATSPQEVVTVINGVEETRNNANTGDRIITGPKNERYIIKEAKFGGLYEEDPSDSSRFISKNVIRAMPIAENTELTAPWGEKQRAVKGGYVAQRVDNPADVYLIEEGAFKATYSPEAAKEAVKGVTISSATEVTGEKPLAAPTPGKQGSGRGR